MLRFVRTSNLASIGRTGVVMDDDLHALMARPSVSDLAGCASTPDALEVRWKERPAETMPIPAGTMLIPRIAPTTRRWWVAIAGLAVVITSLAIWIAVY
jgi:hypothetical protein